MAETKDFSPPPLTTVPGLSVIRASVLQSEQHFRSTIKRLEQQPLTGDQIIGARTAVMLYAYSLFDTAITQFIATANKLLKENSIFQDEADNFLSSCSMPLITADSDLFLSMPDIPQSAAYWASVIYRVTVLVDKTVRNSKVLHDQLFTKDLIEKRKARCMSLGSTTCGTPCHSQRELLHSVCVYTPPESLTASRNKSIW